MQVVMRQLRVWQLVPVRKIMYEGQYRDLVFCTSRIFEPLKAKADFIFYTFFETIFCNFEINGYFHSFFFFGGGGPVEVTLEGFISGIKSFHILRKTIEGY